MKKIIIALILVSSIVLSCQQQKTGSYGKYLNTGNLPVQTFSVNTKSDTLLTTASGIILKIPANSIEASSEIVTIEIKEALSLYDILQSGLTTQSDNGMLTSNGMFYISTKENSIIKKPIQISVPALYADNEMQLYKGNEENGKINWQQPTNIEKQITATTDNGKLLFTGNCASCHAIEKQLTAPALAWMDKRKVDKKILYAFIKNNQEVIKSGNAYYNCLYCAYNKNAMNLFTNLTDDDIDAIIRYVDKEAQRLGIPENFNSPSVCDSCSYYHEYYASLLHTRDSLVINNGDKTKVDITPPPDADPNADNGTIPTKIDPPKYKAEYYQFNITGYGWYNIDDLVEGRFNAKESELTVKVESEFKENVNVFLIIPSFKIFNEGGFLNNNNNEFGFYTNEGKIYLPQNADAFIIGVSEQSGKIYFGQTHFITSLSQNINLSLKESSKELILQSLAFLKIDSMTVKIEKTKNFDSIKNIDSVIGNIADKVSDCNCYTPANIYPLPDSVKSSVRLK